MKKLMKNKRGITLVALVVTIVILLILAGVSLNLVLGNNGIIKKAGDAKRDTEIADIKGQIQMDILSEQVGNQGGITESSLKNILEKYGTINYDSDGKTIKSITTTKGNYEIAASDIWSGTAEKDTSGANIPNVTNIANKTYVTWTESSGTYNINDTQTTEPADWYDYENGKWANLKTTSSNGLVAYWVWIPRFEYVVPTSDTATQIEVKFISKDKTTPDEGYTIHPAFTFNSQPLDGIWVAKFEASSNAPNTVADGGGNSTDYQVQVIPNASSWRNITTNNIFTVCRNMQDTNGALAGSSNINSHMMKNIEWGAVAILSQSKYGIYNPNSKTGTTENGGDGTLQVWNNPYYQRESYAFDNTKENDLDTSISVSNNHIIKTGCAASATDGKDATTTTVCDSYNVGNGPKASTTGTVYGVYDMAGGSWEYVAGCINGQENSEFGVTAGDNTYVDLYTNASNSTADYTGAITGDATAETKGWNGDYAYFPYSGSPVFARGGYCDNGSGAGVFRFYGHDGSYYYGYSFRPVLVVP